MGISRGSSLGTHATCSVGRGSDGNKRTFLQLGVELDYKRQPILVEGNVGDVTVAELLAKAEDILEGLWYGKQKLKSGVGFLLISGCNFSPPLA